MSERVSAGESVTTPEPLRPTHDVSAFDCGKGILDDWLKRRAAANEELGPRGLMWCVPADASSGTTRSPMGRSPRWRARSHSPQHAGSDTGHGSGAARR